MGELNGGASHHLVTADPGKGGRHAALGQPPEQDGLGLVIGVLVLQQRPVAETIVAPPLPPRHGAFA